MDAHFEWRGTTLRLKCKLQPKAAQDKISGVHNQALKISLTSPPVKGKANAHLIRFLSKQFGVAKSAVRIQSGELCQHKVIEVEAPQCIPPECELE